MHLYYLLTSSSSLILIIKKITFLAQQIQNAQFRILSLFMSKNTWKVAVGRRLEPLALKLFYNG